MEYWNWRVVEFVLIIGLIRCIRQYGLRNLWRSLRLWGEGVTPKQRRENLVALGVLLTLAVIGVLFWLIP